MRTISFSRTSQQRSQANEASLALISTRISSVCVMAIWNPARRPDPFSNAIYTLKRRFANQLSSCETFNLPTSQSDIAL